MAQLENKFVLIVDDNATNLAVLSQALKQAGYKVRMAVNGEEAIHQAEQLPPELILLDIQMPGIDGFETCRRLQANSATCNIPVIFMTALSDMPSKLKGLSLGAVDYITKPFEQAEVLARVSVHWRLKQLTDSLEDQVAVRSIALQQAQVQLVQQEKLSTLGELVAGVAHEINNPINFVASNIEPVRDYFADLQELLSLYQQQCQITPEIEEKIAAIDLDFLIEDFAKILDSMEVGTDRIKEISASLRNFARSDQNTRALANLHEGLDSTLMLLKHRLKSSGERPEIEVTKHYGDLPLVECYAGAMNQVFMNLLANAIDALEEAWEKDQRPLTIQICTECHSNAITIQIEDSGIGISEAVKQRLFEPLFTTKVAGKGTGLGLCISQQIVVDRHGGKLTCDSSFDRGTRFTIELPRLNHPD